MEALEIVERQGRSESQVDSSDSGAGAEGQAEESHWQLELPANGPLERDHSLIPDGDQSSLEWRALSKVCDDCGLGDSGGSEEDPEVLVHWYVDGSEDAGYSHAVLCGWCRQEWSHGDQCLWYDHYGMEVECVECAEYNGVGLGWTLFRRC